MMQAKPEFDEDGNEFWYDEDYNLHRLGGPAAKWADGGEEWWVRGSWHRLDGPAITYNYYDENRRQTHPPEQRWWINDEELTQEQFDQHPLVVFYRLSKESKT
jgi:hypothetical protein